jgi:hypothetical protein
MGGNKDQEGNENSDKTEPFVCLFVELEQKLQEL